MNENLSILKKGLILVAVPFVFQAGFIALLVKTYSDAAQAQVWALHTKEVIARAQGTFRRLVEAQYSVIGLVGTGQADYAAGYARAVKDLPGELAQLQRLVADNPAQSAQVATIVAQAGALQAWQRETVRRFEAGDREEAARQIGELRGKPLLDAVREAVDRFIAVEDRLDAKRSAALAQSRRQQALALAGGGVASVAGVLALATILSRGITRRFALLADNARRVAEGQELAAPLSGRDEIARLDRTFHDMARALADKNRENELFIYSVSHDLRSPLVNLQGFSQELTYACRALRGMLDEAEVPERLRDRARRLVDRDMGSSVQFIQTAVSRLSAIIDSLLRLSRAGRVEYRWQPVDVGATVDRVIEALGATITERGAQVTRHGELPPAWGDPTAVEQIFANLVGNAVNYLDPNRPGVVEVGVSEDGTAGTTPLHCYYIKDNGLGIPESGLPKLFLAFQRFHQGAAKGEGIGLALVRRIVERHGGHIRVESTVGAGSTFFVELPAVPAEGGGKAAQPAFEQRGDFV